MIPLVGSLAAQELVLFSNSFSHLLGGFIHLESQFGQGRIPTISYRFQNLVCSLFTNIKLVI